MKEAEVQRILSRWFRNQGYLVEESVKLGGGNRVDLAARSRQGDWFVEVKGDYDVNTAQYNVNFDTGVGQLIKGITRLDDRTKYAIGIPFSRTDRGEKLSYRLILPKYAKSLVFEALNIHLLLVRDDRSVEVTTPSEVKSFLSSIDPRIRR